jgi:hypothetical protein
MFISMATSCLMGQITIGAFISNAEIAVQEMRKIFEDLNTNPQ